MCSRHHRQGDRISYGFGCGRVDFEQNNTLDACYDTTCDTISGWAN
ncbi:MAG: hypothetical protein RID09_20220 [Coleofasciculus sp. G1-WW12-02]